MRMIPNEGAEKYDFKCESAHLHPDRVKYNNVRVHILNLVNAQVQCIVLHQETQAQVFFVLHSYESTHHAQK